jgi:DNA polymerase (family X)
MKQSKLFGGEEPKVIAALELAKAQKLANELIDVIDPRLCEKLEIVGSIRRQRPEIHDIDFIVLASDSNWAKICNKFRKPNVICAGNQLLKFNYPIEGGLFQADLYRAKNDNYGVLKLVRTGSADHNMWLAAYAITKGFRLKYSEGLLQNEQVVAGKTEESVFSALGLPCPIPEEREIVNAKPVWMRD